MKLSLSSRVHVGISCLSIVVLSPALAAQLERTLTDDRAERVLQALRARSRVFQCLLHVHGHKPFHFELARITSKII